MKVRGTYRGKTSVGGAVNAGDTVLTIMVLVENQKNDPNPLVHRGGLLEYSTL